MFKKQKIVLLLVLLLSISGIGYWTYDSNRQKGEVLYMGFEPQVPEGWKRPDGPIKIGLQVGHYKRLEMPDELSNIRDNGGGTSGLGRTEWEVMLVIAEETKEILEEEGYDVDILPATVPKDYWADAFISIHADGNLDNSISGYKVAPYARDRTSLADILSKDIEKTYGEATKLPRDPNITRNMTRYYSFNSRKYDHAIHEMTPGVIVETGFLTNRSDAEFLINNPKVSAKGIALGIINFINQNIEIDIEIDS